MQDFRTKLKKNSFWNEYIICKVAKFQEYKSFLEYLFRMKTKSNYFWWWIIFLTETHTQKQMKGKAKTIYFKDAKARLTFFKQVK